MALVNIRYTTVIENNYLKIHLLSTVATWQPGLAELRIQIKTISMMSTQFQRLRRREEGMMNIPPLPKLICSSSTGYFRKPRAVFGANWPKAPLCHSSSDGL